jgi:hypothetical protein
VTRFDELLRTGVRSARAQEPHLDADQLSAFVENGTGRALVTAHAARCSDCREALFLLSGERFAPQPAWPWRWAWIPAAAAVCALGIAIPILLHRNPRPAAEVIARAVPRQAHLEAETVRQPAPLLETPDLKKAPAHAKGDDERIPNVVQAQPPMAAPPLVEQSQTLPAANPPRQTSAGQVTGQQQDAWRQSNQQVDQAKPPSPGISFFDPQQSSLNQKYRVAPGFAKVAPVRAHQWAIHQGVPEQSADAGLSWRQMPIDASIRFQAIGNLANDVWAGGSGGALVHSNDSGEHWQRVKVTDSGQALTSDVIEIRVISRLEIHVLSASGEQWATQDGGQTWKRE